MFKNKHKTVFKHMLKESVFSVLPVSLIILVLCFTIAPIDVSSFTSFIFGAVMIIVGMALFSLGAEISMTPIFWQPHRNLIRILLKKLCALPQNIGERHSKFQM